MKPRHWWFATALVAFMGCDSSNPNEANFPGAPGSRVPAPPPAPAGAGGGMSKSGVGGLPGNYPGMEKYQKNAAKKADEAPKAAEAAKAPAKDDAKPAPALAKEAAKPAAPEDAAKPAASK